MLIQKLTVELTSEAQRRGALGLLGQHGGSVMIDRNGVAIQREHILNSDGSVIDTELVTFDAKTGLLLPNPLEVSMLLSDGLASVEIPRGYFVHPVTCRLLAIEGLSFNFTHAHNEIICFTFMDGVILLNYD